MNEYQNKRQFLSRFCSIFIPRPHQPLICVGGGDGRCVTVGMSWVRDDVIHPDPHLTSPHLARLPGARSVTACLREYLNSVLVPAFYNLLHSAITTHYSVFRSSLHLSSTDQHAFLFPLSDWTDHILSSVKICIINSVWFWFKSRGEKNVEW